MAAFRRIVVVGAALLGLSGVAGCPKAAPTAGQPSPASTAAAPVEVERPPPVPPAPKIEPGLREHGGGYGAGVGHPLHPDIGLGDIGTRGCGSCGSPGNHHHKGHGSASPAAPETAEPPPPPAVDFDSIQRSFRTAQASYVIPDTMTAGESTHVHLDLSFQKSIAELQADLQKHMPGATITTTTLKTSSIAQARLTGQHFQITAVTDEEQPVGSATTTWEWEVTPDSGGRRPLHLSVDAVVSIGSETRRWTINTFERNVLVRVSAAQRVKDFVGGNWQWLWTTVAVPLALFLFKRRKRR